MVLVYGIILILYWILLIAVTCWDKLDQAFAQRWQLVFVLASQKSQCPEPSLIRRMSHKDLVALARDSKAAFVWPKPFAKAPCALPIHNLKKQQPWSIYCAQALRQRLGVQSSTNGKCFTPWHPWQDEGWEQVLVDDQPLQKWLQTRQPVSGGLVIPTDRLLQDAVLAKDRR